MLSKKTNISRMSICIGSSQRATIGYMLITGVQAAIRWQAALQKLRNTRQPTPNASRRNERSAGRDHTRFQTPACIHREGDASKSVSVCSVPS